MIEKLDILADFHAIFLAVMRIAISPKAPGKVVAIDLPRKLSSDVIPFWPE